MSGFSFKVTIAGIPICFSSPQQMEIPLELRPFLTPDASAQETYEIVLIHQPLQFQHEPVFCSDRLAVYSDEDTVTRVFLPLKAPDGCIPVCRQRKNGQNTLYLPASDWRRYERKCTLSLLLGPESLFLRHDALLLHSSVVQYCGQALLFSGPSGVGKTTQAELWEKYRQAEIINGDRCVIAKRGEQFWGCGSPYSGSSGIYRRKEAPIRAIILPEKAAENRIERISAQKAFRCLYRELLGNLWDRKYTEKLLNLLQALVLQIPVYRLYCRPEEAAIELTECRIFNSRENV